MPVVLEPYNAIWPKTYIDLKKDLLLTFGKLVSNLEHIGGTSIPNIHSQPFVDIVGTSAFLTELDHQLNTNIPAQYKFGGDHGMKDRRFLSVWKPDGTRIAHVHLFPDGHFQHRDRIQFRDYLLKHPDVAKQYNDVKIALAAQHQEDPMKYWEGKGPFVQSVLDRVTNP